MLVRQNQQRMMGGMVWEKVGLEEFDPSFLDQGVF